MVARSLYLKRGQRMADEKARPKTSLPRPLWFGLATVLVLVTGIALRVGVPIYRQRPAVQVVEALGGYASKGYKVPLWMTQWIGNDAAQKFGWLLRDVYSVSLNNTDATDSTLECIRVFSKLETLSLDGTQVTDAGLERLQAFPSLSMLHLNGTQVTDRGLQHLTKGFKRIYKLFVEGTQVTPQGVAELKTTLPGLFVEGVPEPSPATSE
jgi:hypothetical protein